MPDVSAARLHLLRGCYLLLFVGLSRQMRPQIFGPMAIAPLMKGAATATPGALGGLLALGLFALPFFFITPWRYVVHDYVNAPDPWR